MTDLLWIVIGFVDDYHRFFVDYDQWWTNASIASVLRNDVNWLLISLIICESWSDGVFFLFSIDWLIVVIHCYALRLVMDQHIDSICACNHMNEAEFVLQLKAGPPDIVATLRVRLV